MARSEDDTTLTRMSEQPRRRLYFQHAPKTAGTSLAWMLDRFFHHDKIIGPLGEDVPKLLRTTPSALAGADFITGHTGRLPQLIDHQPLTVITVLREPVDQAISMIRHWFDDPRVLFGVDFDRDGRTIDQLLADPDFCRRLTLWSYCYEFGVDDIAIRRFRPSFAWDTELPTPSEARSRAASALGNTNAIVDTHLSTDFVALCRWLGAREPIEPIRKANHRKGILEVSAATRSRLSELFADDIKLYEEACKRAPLQLTEEIAPQPKQILSLNFENPLSGRGWTGRTPLGDSSSRFGRYADLDGAEIDIEVGGLAELKLSFMVWTRDERALRHLRASFNGELLQTTLVYPDPNDRRTARYIASTKLSSPLQSWGTLAFSLDCEFVDSLEDGSHYFSEYDRRMICLFQFIEVTGT